MLQRTLALLALADTAASIKLMPRQPAANLSDIVRPTLPGELRKSDEIVYDKLAWKPNCTDVFEYAKSNPAEFSVVFGGKDLPDVDACVEYEQSALLSPPPATHRVDTTRKKPIYLLHVSKSGGTFFCNCGNINGRNPGLSHSPRYNCQYLKEDFPSWGMSDGVPWFARPVVAHKSTCEELAKRYQDGGITLEGNENYLAGGASCGHFETALVMRDPIHRLASHMVELSRGLSGMDPMAVTAGEMFKKWPRLVNNYFARSLSDASDYYAALDALPGSLYRRAKRSLHKFDHVFVVERELATEMERQFEWTCEKARGRGSPLANGTQSVVEHWRNTWPKEDWQLLQDRNMVDIKLFRDVQLLSFARRLSVMAQKTNKK